ncbi:MAG: hypothetical protein RJA36_1703 [Pseudomonadota bacterium]|jgi:diguanylate cyclase (GGDEF)-like protein/PAS domain S-box-containing protein
MSPLNTQDLARSGGLEPERYARLIRLVGAVILLLGVLSVTTSQLLQQPVRPGAWIIIAQGAGMLALLGLGRMRWAALLLCWGGLAVGLLGAWSTAGLRSTALIALPIACLSAGWLLGRRAAFALAASSTAGILLLFSLHRLDWAFESQLSLEPTTVALIGATLASALVGSAIADGFGQQLNATEQAWAQLHAIIESSDTPIWAVAASDFSLTCFNAAATELAQRDLGVELVPGMPLRALFHDSAAASRWESLYRRALTQGRLTSEYAANGRNFVFDINPVRQRDGVGGVAVFAKEVTRERALQRMRQQALQRLRESEETFRRLFEHTRQPTALLVDNRFTAANAALLALLRMERPDQIVGRMPADISPPSQPDGADSLERSRQISETIERQGWADFEWELRRADGECIDAQIQITRITMDKQQVAHAVFSDVSEQKMARAQIEYLAYHDALTGLPNRMLGRDRLQQALAAAARDQDGLTLLFLDLDRFKDVNDTHGHHVGDALLRAVADRLRGCTRQADTLCRIAGDEFMVVMPGLCEPPQVSAVCERIIGQLRRPVPLHGVQVSVGTSIGIAIHPRDGLDAETLMLNADTALYESKKDRMGRYRYFEPRMNAELALYLETRQALQQALERQEFELHYQPQIDLRSGAVLGAEALIRWHRPGHGLVAPDDFIHVAEDSGLMELIGRWVLQRACRQAAAWRDAGMGPLVVAVNLSATQFRHAEFEDTVTEALAASGLPPSQLELELTESTLLQLDAQVQQMIARWKAAGIRLAIDDFGTGYSNLAYLKQLAVDKIKIDRSFVLNLQQQAQDRAIVGAMIQVANRLGLRCIAEGIENEATAQLLREMGCDEAQGYCYGRPMPAAEFERWRGHGERRHGAGDAAAHGGDAKSGTIGVFLSPTMNPDMSDTTARPALPDHLSIDPRSPHHVAAVFEHDIGIRFNDKERSDVAEYCISEGWVKVPAGKTVDRKGFPLLIKIKGKVEVYYR